MTSFNRTFYINQVMMVDASGKPDGSTPLQAETQDGWADTCSHESLYDAMVCQERRFAKMEGAAALDDVVDVLNATFYAENKKRGCTLVRRVVKRVMHVEQTVVDGEGAEIPVEGQADAG